MAVPSTQLPSVGLRMLAKPRRVLLVILVLAGSWQLGLGLYIHAKAVFAQVLLERAWAATLLGQQQVKPWPWADTWPVARMKVPRLGIDLIVLDGDSGRNLAFAPGHNPASPLPGDIGNSFISAHRDTHFRFLQNLKPGDVIEMQRADGQRFQYRVENAIVENASQAVVTKTEEVSRLILVTCYPFDAIVPGGEQRYLVSAVDDVNQTSVVF